MLVAFQEQATAAGRGSIVDGADFFDLPCAAADLREQGPDRGEPDKP